MTATHTRYFDADSLAPVVDAIDALAADWETRRPHVSEEVALAGDLRLSVAKAGVLLLAEPVPEALYR